MAQHDYNIANQTGANFRADLNNALSAISSNNSGSSEPSTMYAYEWWIDTSSNVLKLRNSSNNAWITMPFSITADNTIDINAGTVNGITSFSFSSGSTVTTILDEDNLGSDSATALATQQSIKAYVDSQVTAQDLDISDGSSTIAIDLDSETLSLLGGTGVTSAASGNGVTFAIGQSVGTSDNVVFNQVTGALVGNASTATALATARTISGVSFDGTANITLDTDDIGEGTNKYFTAERVDDQVNTLLTAGANISLTYDDAAGTLTIANTNSADITSVVAGDGLTGGGTSGDVTLAVGVDDSSIEINSDALRVKASGITNAMLAGSIANAKLANSSITVNSQAISLGGSHTFDTDDIGEGSSNLYYTDARANSAIDARVTNTFINNLSGVVADTATALATGRTIALSGDVTASGVSFDGTGNITLSTTIAANSVALGTDTTGNYVATIAGTTNEIDVSGSGSETATVTIGLPDDVTIAGNLTVNGTTTTVNSDTLAVTDPLIKLAKANSGADSLDIGFYGLYDTSGSQDLYAGLFRDANDSGKFKLFKDLQVEPTTTVNTSGTGYAVGTLVSSLEGNVTGNVTGTVSSISNHSTSDLSEGTNLYYTDARFDTRLGTKTTDNLTEGSSNLYMTTERVQDIAGGMVTGNTETGITVTYDDTDGTLDFVVGTLNQDTTGNAATATALETARTIGGTSFDGTGNIDLAGVNTTGNQDTSGNAATATALATGRTIGMTGDVVWTSASFDGSGNVTGTATIQANSVALGTDTTGDYVGTITGGTGITSTGATSGEGVAHSLSVDAAQPNITSVGTLTTLDVTSSASDAVFLRSSQSTTTNVYITNTNATTGNTANLYFAPANNVSGALISSIAIEDFSSSANRTADLAFSTRKDGTMAERMRIDSSGNVGIGTTSPSHKLQVNDNSAGNTTYAIVSDNNGASGTTVAGLGFANGGSLKSSITAAVFGNDFMTFNVGGSGTTERMRIDSSGRLGIGTTSPNGKLTISNGGAGGFEFTPDTTAFSVANSNYLASYDRSASAYRDIVFDLGGAESQSVRFKAGGNVGIGTSSPAKTLEVNAGTNTEMRIGTTTNGSLQLGHFGNGTFIGTDSGTPSAADLVRLGTGGAERMRIDSSGNVGIGTSSPSFGSGSGLEIERAGIATIRLQNSNSKSVEITQDSDFTIESKNSGSNILLMPTSNVGIGTTSPSQKLDVDSGHIAVDAGYGLVWSGDADRIITPEDNSVGGLFKVASAAATRFMRGSSESMRIDSSGNLLVGTTNTSAGIGNTDQGHVISGNNNYASHSRNGNVPLFLNRNTSHGDILSFRYVGNEVGSVSVTNTATAFNTSSDARLKDVTGEARGLEVINELNPVAYNWKADGKADEGLIAQEVLDVVPNAVSGSEEDMYQMDYSKLVEE